MCFSLSPALLNMQVTWRTFLYCQWVQSDAKLLVPQPKHHDLPCAQQWLLTPECPKSFLLNLQGPVLPAALEQLS